MYYLVRIVGRGKREGMGAFKKQIAGIREPAELRTGDCNGGGVEGMGTPVAPNL
jgi:hypothetical protein